MSNPKQIQSRTAALAIAALGLILTIAGPLLPGGQRLVRISPPDAAHVTILAGGATDPEQARDLPIYAGTAAGEIWRYESGLWQYERLTLDGQPVTAITGDPKNHPVGTAGGLFNTPTGVAFPHRVADIIPTAAGFVVGNDAGIHLLSPTSETTVNAGQNVYRLIAQPVDHQTTLHAGTMGEGVYSIPQDRLTEAPEENWKQNNLGLPESAYVYSFTVTDGGKLIAGTKTGLFWQPHAGTRWQPLHAGFSDSRILSLYLAPATEGKPQTLWIGADGDLLHADLVETKSDLQLSAPAVKVKQPDDPLQFGVSAIRPTPTGVMISAGDVYQWGKTRVPGWYWISLGGILLLLISGWMLPHREVAAT